MTVAGTEVEVQGKKKRSRKGLVIGLVIGGVLCATAVILFSPPGEAGGSLAGTEGAPSRLKELLAQAQVLIDAAREQVREAVDEGKATAQTTQTTLTQRYQAVRANPDQAQLR